VRAGDLPGVLAVGLGLPAGARSLAAMARLRAAGKHGATARTFAGAF